MSSASDLTSAIVAAQSAAVVVINEKASADARVIELTSALDDADRNLQIAVDALADLRAEFDAYKAAHPDDTPPPPPPPPPATKTLLGCSTSKWAHPGHWDYMRCYDPPQVDTAVNTHGAVRVGLSFKDDPGDPAVVVSRLKAIKAKYPKLLIDYAENEVDRHRTPDAAWARETKAISEAISAAFPDGSVLGGVDFTHQASVEDFYKALQAGGFDWGKSFAALSLYPSGRKQTPPVESPIAEHIDQPLNLAKKYGVKRVICWEIATPLSAKYDRPTVAAKYAPRFVQVAQANGQEPVAVCWWDGFIDIDNRLQNDAPKTQQAFQASLG